MVTVNGLKNDPICPEHVTNATCIFGSNTAALEGKTVRRPSPRVIEEGGGVNIPDDFHRLRHFVTLIADVFFMDRVDFLMTLSRHIRLTTVEHILGQRACVLADGLQKIIRTYARGRFMVNLVLMDQEFDNYIAIVNTCATNEHVTDAERNVCMTKDSMRCSAAEFRRIGVHTLPK